MGVDRVQPGAAGVEMVEKAALAPAPEGQVGLVPGLEAPGPDLLAAVAHDATGAKLGDEIPPRAHLVWALEIVEQAGGVAHDLEDGPQAPLDQGIQGLVEQ